MPIQGASGSVAWCAGRHPVLPLAHHKSNAGVEFGGDEPVPELRRTEFLASIVGAFGMRPIGATALAYLRRMLSADQYRAGVVTSYLFLLTGFPGSGKLTVAQALAQQIESEGDTVRVVDNHWINNPIFGLVAQDGVTPLPREVWTRVGEVASAVIRTVEELTPRAWHVIFTAYLDGVTDTGFAPRLEQVAAPRGSVFVPVRLVIDPEENARRIVSPERRVRMKSVDPAEPFRLAALGEHTTTTMPIR